MIGGHGGNIHELARQLGCDPTAITDMSSNVNPLGPPPGLRDHLQASLEQLHWLPEVDAHAAIAAFSRWHGVKPQQVLAGNGTTQLIYTLPRALECRKALILGPTYADYADACRMHGVSFDYLSARLEDGFFPDLEALDRNAANPDIVFICNPNNPTGRLIPADGLIALCRAHRRTFFVVDESYLPFAPNSQSLMGTELENLVVLNSMSKIFRVPGLRIGFVKAPESVIARFMRYFLPWSVNALAQAAVCFLAEQGESIAEFVKTSQRFLHQERTRFVEAFSDSPGIRFFPSTTSFLLARLSRPLEAGTVCQALARQGILIRNCANFTGLSERYIRISLKTAPANQGLAKLLGEILADPRKE